MSATNVSVTRLGSSLWDWPPWGNLDCLARNLWLALYTCAAVKRLLPGLYHGSFSSLVEDARMGAIDAQAAMTALTEAKLCEWDQRCRVIRLTEFPDDAERPDNGNLIYAWWTRFKSVPQCAVRDAHVVAIKSLFEDRPMTSDHERVWGTTFGTLKAKVLRRRHTEQAQQPDLFLSAAMPTMHHREINRCSNGMGNPLDLDLDLDQSLTLKGSAEGGTDQRDPGSGRSDLLTPQMPLASTLPPATGAVVPDTGLSVAEVIGALTRGSSGRFVGTLDRRLDAALETSIAQAASQGFTLADVEALATWWGSGGMGWRDDLGPSWATRPGHLAEALERARAWKLSGSIPPRNSHAMPSPTGIPNPLVATPKNVGRVEPAAAQTFHTGRRSLS